MASKASFIEELQKKLEQGVQHKTWEPELAHTGLLPRHNQLLHMEMYPSFYGIPWEKPNLAYD